MGEYFTTQGAEGLELVRWARERDPSTRIIILTAYGSGETEREARRLGASAFPPQAAAAVRDRNHRVRSDS